MLTSVGLTLTRAPAWLGSETRVLEVRRDDSEIAKPLRIEEREMTAAGRN
jgi:hypothetical protein